MTELTAVPDPSNPSKGEYTLRVANHPDADGDYKATVLRDGTNVNSLFRKSRDEAVAAATAWAARHREERPDDYEEIPL